MVEDGAIEFCCALRFSFGFVLMRGKYLCLLFKFDFNGSVIIFAPIRQTRVALAHDLVQYDGGFGKRPLFFFCHDDLHFLLLGELVLLFLLPPFLRPLFLRGGLKVNVCGRLALLKYLLPEHKRSCLAFTCIFVFYRKAQAPSFSHKGLKPKVEDMLK